MSPWQQGLLWPSCWMSQPAAKNPPTPFTDSPVSVFYNTCNVPKYYIIYLFTVFVIYCLSLFGQRMSGQERVGTQLHSLLWAQHLGHFLAHSGDSVNLCPVNEINKPFRKFCLSWQDDRELLLLHYFYLLLAFLEWQSLPYNQEGWKGHPSYF